MRNQRPTHFYRKGYVLKNFAKFSGSKVLDRRGRFTGVFSNTNIDSYLWLDGTVHITQAHLPS